MGNLQRKPLQSGTSTYLQASYILAFLSARSGVHSMNSLVLITQHRLVKGELPDADHEDLAP
jgi:hypothetical protein